MRSIRYKVLVVAIAVVAALSVVTLSSMSGSAKPSVEAVAASQQPTHPTISESTPTVAQASQIVPVVAASVPAAGVNAGTLSAQVNTLVSKATPQASFEAYKLLTYCDTARTSESYARSNTDNLSEVDRENLARKLSDGTFSTNVSRTCGDLTAQQVAARWTYLEKAAEAGVKGAAVLLAAHGPGIDGAELEKRWYDADVQQWRQHTLELIKLAANGGDLEALRSLKDMYSRGAPLVPTPDPKTALIYATAYDAIYSQQNGHPPPWYHQKQTKEIEAAVSPNLVQEAKQEGLSLAQGGKK